MKEAGEARQRGLIAPDIDADSQAWWEAVAQHRLLLPHCRSCDLTWFPPMPACPRCGSRETELCESIGKGSVYSWVVVNRSLSPVFAGDTPYVIAAVDLEHGARLLGRLLASADNRHLRAGAPVIADFYEVQGQTLVGFRLV
jgi:uncharacterized OB-fold protein